MNNKFVYVYVDEDGLIEEISLNKTSSELVFYKIPETNSGELLTLKKTWDNHPLGFREKYMLVENEAAYFIEKVILIYYNNEQIIISSRKEQEYEDDNTLKRGYVKFDQLIVDFIDGKKGKDLHYYKVEETPQLLTITKKELSDYLQDIELIDAYKVELTKNGQFEMFYHRKKKLLKIKCYKEESNYDALIYFTQQYDPTILLASTEFKLDGKTHTFKNVTLPKLFNIYSPLGRIASFSFKEI